MPPRSPLPQRHGLDAAWIRTPDRDPAAPATWNSLRDWLDSRLGKHIDVDQFIAEGRFVYEDGSAVPEGAPYRDNVFVWFQRDLAEEAPVPGSVNVVHQDERIVVVDKPAFLSSIPRGRHVLESVVVRLRDRLGLPELTPMHRLDRVTSGLLVLTTEKRWRGPYQSMFQRAGAIQKQYRAVAALDERLAVPAHVENFLEKRHGTFQAEVVEGREPNARSIIELERALSPSEVSAEQQLMWNHSVKNTEWGLYRLTPLTGRTHQLRMHMWGLGLPIAGDPLYPVDRGIEIDDFTMPLQLLASDIAFTDPVSGEKRAFSSGLTLPA